MLCTPQKGAGWVAADAGVTVTRNAQAKPLAAAGSGQGVGDTHTHTHTQSTEGTGRWRRERLVLEQILSAILKRKRPYNTPTATTPCILNMQMDTRNYFIIHTSQKAMRPHTHPYTLTRNTLEPRLLSPQVSNKFSARRVRLCATPTHLSKPSPSTPSLGPMRTKLFSIMCCLRCHKKKQKLQHETNNKGIKKKRK